MIVPEFFITKGAYFRYLEWCYAEPIYEYCAIEKTSDEHEIEEGRNFISAGGSEGVDLEVFNTLEEAIYNSTYKRSSWNKINLSGLCDCDKERAEHFIKLAQDPDIYKKIKEEYVHIKGIEKTNSICFENEELEI